MCTKIRLLAYSRFRDIDLKNFVGDEPVPPYAILSHTWGSDADEVGYDDLENKTGENKPGWGKIHFCGQQAIRDSLQYIWVDTCCINKGDLTELSYSIISMYRWYQNAARCYVYLSDVSSKECGEGYNHQLLESLLGNSRWFTRGWTLQELLAPTSVEFFSREGRRLGDKESLMQQIHKITRISVFALRGTHLSQFSVDERISWAELRQTKEPEDCAYSLLGVLDVSMPVLYGEGKEKALRRLRHEVEKFPGSEGTDRPSSWIAPFLSCRCGVIYAPNSVAEPCRCYLPAPLKFWSKTPQRTLLHLLSGSVDISSLGKR